MDSRKEPTTEPLPLVTLELILERIEDPSVREDEMRALLPVSQRTSQRSYCIQQVKQEHAVIQNIRLSALLHYNKCG